ncbi:hypothetical protein MLD55_14165 [Alcanivorax sp. MM125-6]|nr:hypothetical protein [Alcanivorax sp. MM125-6]
MKPTEIVEKFPLLREPLEQLALPGHPNRLALQDRLFGILDGLKAAGALDWAEHSSMVCFVIGASVSDTLVFE